MPFFFVFKFPSKIKQSNSGINKIELTIRVKKFLKRVLTNWQFYVIILLFIGDKRRKNGNI